jgi:hypothetical protein
MDKEEFDLHRDIADWLMNNGFSFKESLAIISYAIKTDSSIPIAYFNLIKIDDPIKPLNEMEQRRKDEPS